MNALLIIAHGSRSAKANEEVLQLAAGIERQAGTAFTRIVHAYLEIADPSVDRAIDELAESGITNITVFPYFLAFGSHVADDVPRMVDEAKEKHPHIRFRILPHLGALKGIDSVILNYLDTGGA